MSDNNRTEDTGVEIEIQEEGQTEESTTLNLEGMLPEEIAMAKEHGLIKDQEEEENGEHKEHINAETERDSDKKEKEQEKVEDKPDFDEVEKDESKISAYNANEKALYFRWKNDKKKRQSLEKEFNELKSSKELDLVKNKASEIKLNKIKEALGNEDLTVEQLQAIIDGEVVASSDKDKPLTKADLEKIEADKNKQIENQQKAESEARERLASIEEIGRSKIDNFAKIYVEEMEKNDKTLD
jgi:hypothetical protein